MKHDYSAVVIGTSAGGMAALEKIIPNLPDTFSLPIIIVQHMHKTALRFLAEYLNNKSILRIKEADEKEPIKRGYVYVAPPDYHLLVEDDETFSLSVDKKVNYSRPSIDVLFESAADVYKSKLIGIILSGASKDGARGLKTIKNYGGLAVIQNPEEAESTTMPKAALKSVKADHILSLNEITRFLKGKSQTPKIRSVLSEV